LRFALGCILSPPTFLLNLMLLLPFLPRPFLPCQAGGLGACVARSASAASGDGLCSTGRGVWLGHADCSAGGLGLRLLPAGRAILTSGGGGASTWAAQPLSGQPSRCRPCHRSNLDRSPVRLACCCLGLLIP
jgi:hypothetical protein